LSILLAGRGVSRSFGARRVLEPCDVELHAGELVALVGPNGAGKSTLLSILAGALDPSSGRVELSARVGWAPQRPALYGRLTPRENLELFARLDGQPSPPDVGLPDTPAATHSVGMRQRLNLALAFLGDPDVLLLDEPTASLDPSSARDIRARIRDFAAHGTCGVLWTSHNMYEVEAVCDRVLFLSRGRLLLEGDPKTLPAEHGKHNLEELFITVAREPLSLGSME
jgi:ABC-2 type transport system ATP-binding protein